MANSSSGLAPETEVFRMMLGGAIAQAVGAVAKLGIPDALAERPKTAKALAAELSLNAEALERMLRALGDYELFSVDEAGVFSNGRLGEVLRSDALGSQRNFAIYCSSLPLFKIWDRAVDVLRTGEPSPSSIFGVDYWEYLKVDPEHGKLFNQGMTSMTAPTARAFAAKVKDDLLRFETVVDVAGGQGIFLGTVLATAKHLRATLFDQVDVLESSRPVLARFGVSERVELVGGNFFESIPSGRDLYFMKRTLHDWSDDDARKILNVCRKAMRPDSELWLVEPVIPEDSTPHFGRVIDVYMMVLLGGRERTVSDWKSLLASAQLSLREVKDIDGTDSIVVARPV